MDRDKVRVKNRRAVYHDRVRVSPQVVIFDYGNVLSQSQSAADVQTLANILDLPVDRFTELYWEFRVAYDEGSLDAAAYWSAVAQASARQLSPEQIDALTQIDSRSWSHPAPVMPQWAMELRASGIRTGLLSNMPASVRDYIVRCPWLPQFQTRVFSCDFGRCKPAPEIYRHCLDQLRASPSEALFLDDKEPNIRAAEALGLHSILFTDPASALLQVTTRFNLPAPGRQ